MKERSGGDWKHWSEGKRLQGRYLRWILKVEQRTIKRFDKGLQKDKEDEIKWEIWDCM